MAALLLFAGVYLDDIGLEFDKCARHHAAKRIKLSHRFLFC